MCGAGELFFYAQAINGGSAREHGRLLERARGLALVGNPWWNDLVYRRGPELRGFARARHRSGDFVRDWAGSNDGFRHLGSFYLEGICQCTSEREKAHTTDVHLFRRWAGRNRGGSGISEVTAPGKN